MKENKYDDLEFFITYSRMPRSTHGLHGAGEWYMLRSMLPALQDKTVLDLGCGYGWHCRYMRESGASKVVGVDISEKMLEQARVMTNDSAIEYIRLPIEDINFKADMFDVVFSSLALHYIENYGELCRKIYGYLKPGGAFVFSAEHPIFTCLPTQDWCLDEKGSRLHWPIDNYQDESVRNTNFLGHKVIKYHRTMATWVNELVKAGFTIRRIEEPEPDEQMQRDHPALRDDARRPIFLLIAASKKD